MKERDGGKMLQGPRCVYTLREAAPRRVPMLLHHRSIPSDGIISHTIYIQDTNA
jgi:hypothetical protein